MSFFGKMSEEEIELYSDRGDRWDLFFKNIANDGFFRTVINYWKKKKHCHKVSSYMSGDDESIFQERYKFWGFMADKEKKIYERFLASAEITRKYYNDALEKLK